MNLRSVVLSVLSVFTATQAAFASSWVNLGPISSGDMQVFVDYMPKVSIPAGDVWTRLNIEPQGPASYQYDADPLWVNVKRANLSQNDHVFVQVISYENHCYRGQCSSNNQSISEKNLDFAETGRFTGQLPSILLMSQLNDGYALSSTTVYKQEIVVWINGNLYKNWQGNNLSLPLPTINTNN